MNLENVNEAINYLTNLSVKKLVHPKQKAFFGPRNHELSCPLTAIARYVAPDATDSYDYSGYIATVVEGFLDSDDLLSVKIINAYDGSSTKIEGKRRVIKVLQDWKKWNIARNSLP